ncbi:MAG: hypothetical protein PHF51_03655 [Candidatus ainarchaeum sp.]|nr:hypothetical protein [Candidatus ainarchaeum sp.]
MIGKQVIESRPVTLVEVADIMEKRLEDAEAEAKRRKKEKLDKPVLPPAAPVAPEGEGGVEVAEGAPGVEAPVAPVPAPVEDKSPLGLEQRSTLEYSKKFAKLGKRKAADMVEKLLESGKMKPEIAVKVVDLMPENKEQVKLLFAKERVTASDDDVSAVVKLVQEFKK